MKRFFSYSFAFLAFSSASLSLAAEPSQTQIPSNQEVTEDTLVGPLFSAEEIANILKADLAEVRARLADRWTLVYNQTEKRWALVNQEVAQKIKDSGMVEKTAAVVDQGHVLGQSLILKTEKTYEQTTNDLCVNGETANCTANRQRAKEIYRRISTEWNETAAKAALVGKKVLDDTRAVTADGIMRLRALTSKYLEKKNSDPTSAEPAASAASAP